MNIYERNAINQNTNNEKSTEEKNIYVKDVLKVTNGKLVTGNPNIKCEKFSRDTRIIEKGDIFVAIKGNTYNGNIFWKEALDNGAEAVIIEESTQIEEKELERYKEKTIIKVENTITAVQQIAKYKRSLYDIPVIGITGSVGKTSTRDLIASVISQKYKTLSTVGNQNNDIGLPFTILKLKDHEAAVIEMGMNHLGEIRRLSKITKPTISVITNIGTSHIGDVGSRENILKAKLEILEGMEEGKIIINNDNDLLHEWYQNNKNEYNNIITCGIENQSTFMAEDILEYDECSEFICRDAKEKSKLKVPISGKHFIYNAMCAIAVGKELGLTNEQIKKGIEETELTKNRMQIIKLDNDITIISDCYNASYESMKVALEYLGRNNKKRKIAILGDILDLGEYAQDLHRKVGDEVVKNKIDILVCTGNQAKDILKRVEELGMKQENLYYEPNIEAIINKIKNIIHANDEILIKASNRMKFFNIVEELTKDIS